MNNEDIWILIGIVVVIAIFLAIKITWNQCYDVPVGIKKPVGEIIADEEVGEPI